MIQAKDIFIKIGKTPKFLNTYYNYFFAKKYLYIVALHTFEETISTPTENAITNLWEAMAAKFIQTPEASSSRPRVKPVMAL